MLDSSKSKLKKFSILMMLVLPVSSAFAGGFQKFYNIAYDNPASLNRVKKSEVMLGATNIWGILHFTGTSGALNGTATSDRHATLPYGRFAWRLSPRFVASLDISNLMYLNTHYPTSSILRNVSVNAVLRDVNFGQESASDHP